MKSFAVDRLEDVFKAVGSLYGASVGLYVATCGVYGAIQFSGEYISGLSIAANGYYVYGLISCGISVMAAVGVCVSLCVGLCFALYCLSYYPRTASRNGATK